jgi:hypothetical protein
MTALEMTAVLIGFAKQMPLFYDMLVYGSPFYALQHAFTEGSMMYEKHLLYWGFLVFHLLKYFVIFQAQRKDEPNLIRNMALLFEAIYLSLSAYYLL